MSHITCPPLIGSLSLRSWYVILWLQACMIAQLVNKSINNYKYIDLVKRVVYSRKSEGGAGTARRDPR